MGPGPPGREPQAGLPHRGWSWRGQRGGGFLKAIPASCGLAAGLGALGLPGEKSEERTEGGCEGGGRGPAFTRQGRLRVPVGAELLALS